MGIIKTLIEIVMWAASTKSVKIVAAFFCMVCFWQFVYTNDWQAFALMIVCGVTTYITWLDYFTEKRRNGK